MSDLENFSGIWFLVQQAISKISTNTLVKVVSFTPNPGGGLLAGLVTVQPLVNQVDPQGNATPRGEISGVPYFRLQAGNSAIILDPVAGDIGFAGFCDRDISSVKANSGQANPGSLRRFDMSDGIYFGGIGSLNGTATQFIQFLPNAAGINITTPGTLNINAGTVNIESSTANITSNTNITGNASITGTMSNNGQNVGSTHKHPVTNVQAGSSTIETGAPNE